MSLAMRAAAGSVLVLLGACASGDPAEFDRRLTTYVGRPEADLISGLGVPSRTYDGDGRRLLQYDFVQPAPGPGIVPSLGLGFGSFGFGSGVGVGTGLGFGFPAGGAPRGCSVVFETREGQVQGFNRNGPGCTV